MVQFHSSAGGYPIFPLPLLKKLSFLHCVFLAPLSKISWLYVWGLLLGCLIVPLVYMSVFMPIPMSQLFASDDQNTGASASASALPTSIQGWSPLRLTGLISLLSKTSMSLLQHHNSKASILWCSAFFMVQLSQPYVTTGKTIALTIQTFVSRVMSAFQHTV